MESKIKADYLTAMKSKDAVGKNTLSLLISAMNNEKIALQRDLTNEDVIKIINKEIKKRRQSTEAYILAQRALLAAKEEEEARVLERYLPKALTYSELVLLAKQFKSDNPGIHPGKLFGMINKESNGLIKPEEIRQAIEQA